MISPITRPQQVSDRDQRRRRSGDENTSTRFIVMGLSLGGAQSRIDEQFDDDKDRVRVVVTTTTFDEREFTFTIDQTARRSDT